MLKSIYSHQSFNKTKGILTQKSKDRYQRYVNALINEDFHQKFWNKQKTILLQSELKKIQQDRKSPYLLARKLLGA